MNWLAPEKIDSLQHVTADGWDPLCDGCGICCLYKVRSPSSSTTQLTRVACRYLDIETCTCSVYEQRHDLMPSCINLTKENIRQYDWLPETCAYRRIAEGKPLPWWHYLRSSKHDLVHQLGISVRGIAVSEKKVDLNELNRYVTAGW